MPTPQKPSWATKSAPKSPLISSAPQEKTSSHKNSKQLVGTSSPSLSSTSSSVYETPKLTSSGVKKTLQNKLKDVNMDSKKKIQPKLIVTSDTNKKPKSENSEMPKKQPISHLSLQVHSSPRVAYPPSKSQSISSFSSALKFTPTASPSQGQSPSPPFPNKTPVNVLFKSKTSLSKPKLSHSSSDKKKTNSPKKSSQNSTTNPNQQPSQRSTTGSNDMNFLPKYAILKENLEKDEKPFPEDYKILHRFFKESNLKAFQNYLKENSNLLDDFHEIRNNCGGNLLAAAAFRKMSPVSVLISELDKNLYSQQIGLLIAVDMNNYEVMLLILRRTKFLKKEENLNDTLMIPYNGLTGFSNRYIEDYPQYVTPMLIACEKDDFISIKVLLSYGHKLHTPHEIGCCCYFCTSDKDYTLSEAIARYRYFKGLTSPAYICLTNIDPVLRAFRLKQKLQKSSEKEPEFANEYLELSQKCIDFATELLELCRTREEALILLSQSSEFKTCNWRPMNRVVQALELECGDFVAHATCQQVITDEWYRHNQWIKTSGYLKITLVFILNTIMLPLNALTQILAPVSLFAERQKCPSKRYMNSISSYAIFLFLTFSIAYLTISNRTRGTADTVMVYFLVIYVIGMWVEKFTLVSKRGKGIFLINIWNLYDVLMLTFYTLTFLLWAICTREIGINTLFNDTPRKYWPSSEPNLITECFFTVAILLSFGRLFSFMQSSKVIGPLQLCAIRMVLYVGPFMLILSIVWFSFAVCLFIIYSYYTSLCFEKVDSVQTIHSTSFWQSIHFVIWLFLGLYEKTFGRLVVPEITVKVGEHKTNLHHQHTLTQNTGFAVIDLFYLLGMVLLLNMLIAIMTDAYAEISESSIKEFKVNRTKLWLGFFYQEQQLPPPFNLFPKLLTFYKIFTKTSLKDSKKTRTQHIIGRDDEVYQELMDRLVKRYFRIHYNEQLNAEGNQAVWQEK